MLKFIKNKKIMIVVAHPDDEIIGIGATIHKLVNEYNSEVKCLILGEGITSRDPSRNIKHREGDLKKHNQDILKAKEIIGYSDLTTYNFPDNRFDSIPLLDIIKVVEKEKNLFSPEIILTHHSGDLNIDHQITNKAVITACRPTLDESVRLIITFETFSGTEWQVSNNPDVFRPNLFVEISKENLDAKKRAMDSYSFEKRNFPHPRSSKSLEVSAIKNGINIGYNLAESFCIVRMLA